jgi:hypothetical protein
VGDELLVAYSRFYLYQDPGLFSEAQGVRVVRFDLKALSATPAVAFRRRGPPRAALLAMVDHFIAQVRSCLRAVTLPAVL